MSIGDPRYRCVCGESISQFNVNLNACVHTAKDRTLHPAYCSLKCKLMVMVAGGRDRDDHGSLNSGTSLENFVRSESDNPGIARTFRFTSKNCVTFDAAFKTLVLRHSNVQNELLNKIDNLQAARRVILETGDHMEIKMALLTQLSRHCPCNAFDFEETVYCECCSLMFHHECLSKEPYARLTACPRCVGEQCSDVHWLTFDAPHPLNHHKILWLVTHELGDELVVDHLWHGPEPRLDLLEDSAAFELVTGLSLMRQSRYNSTAALQRDFDALERAMVAAVAVDHDNAHAMESASENEDGELDSESDIEAVFGSVRKCISAYEEQHCCLGCGADDSYCQLNYRCNTCGRKSHLQCISNPASSVCPDCMFLKRNNIGAEERKMWAIESKFKLFELCMGLPPPVANILVSEIDPVDFALSTATLRAALRVPQSFSDDSLQAMVAKIVSLNEESMAQVIQLLAECHSAQVSEEEFKFQIELEPVETLQKLFTLLKDL